MKGLYRRKSGKLQAKRDTASTSWDLSTMRTYETWPSAHNVGNEMNPQCKARSLEKLHRQWRWARQVPSAHRGEKVSLSVEGTQRRGKGWGGVERDRCAQTQDRKLPGNPILQESQGEINTTPASLWHWMQRGKHQLLWWILPTTRNTQDLPPENKPT